LVMGESILRDRVIPLQRSEIFGVLFSFFFLLAYCLSPGRESDRFCFPDFGSGFKTGSSAFVRDLVWKREGLREGEKNKKYFLLTIYRKGMRLIFLNQDKDIVRQRK
jgi:hypothetical protein